LRYIFDLFLTIVGDKPLGALSHEDIRKFKAAIMKLPSNRTKRPQYRDKSVAELLEMSLPKDDLLSAAAMNEHMTKVRGLLGFGVSQGYIQINYAQRMTLPKNTRDDEDRDPYTDAELARLKAALLTMPFKKDYQKWVPLIGMYSAMRLEEICQLTLDDIREEGGVLCFDVHERDDDHNVKTVHGRRLVPVHPTLKELGLLEYIAQLKTAGATRLFPHLNRNRDGYGQTPSRWYNDRFLPKLLIDKTFHGLRHTGATRMREAEVPLDLVSDILGHSRSGNETGRYAKAAGVQRKLDALSKLTY